TASGASAVSVLSVPVARPTRISEGVVGLRTSAVGENGATTTCGKSAARMLANNPTPSEFVMPEARLAARRFSRPSGRDMVAAIPASRHVGQLIEVADIPRDRA